MLGLSRREFITLLGGAAIASPVAARAQQLAMPVVGFLRNSSLDGSVHLLSALRRGLNDGGHIEGQNLLVEYRWSDNQLDRLPALAADLVRRQCAVIVAGGNAAALAAKAATATIPIVFATGEDPINIGLVPSLNRPEGNVTGIFFYSGTDLQSKQLELLREVVPNTRVIGVLVNPKSPQAEFQATNAQEAARALGLSTSILNVTSENDFDRAFATLAQQQVGALLITGDALFTGQVERLIALSARHRIPAIQGLREFAAAGALMTYGASITDAYHEVGVYTSKILKGTKPAELPIMQPTKYELVINLKTAKALGLEIPPTLLTRADEVIE
jgi:putative ABC transport system substrate-binding protein